MILNEKTGLVFLFVFCFASVGISGQAKIDRKAVVDRHRIVTTKTNPRSPAQVGNGEFAFSVDITGLQTFCSFQYDVTVELA